MRLRNGWRAGYAEMCKSGSEGGSRKPDLEIDQGVGFLPNKTTSSVFIAHALAQLGKTLLIDADPQGSSMSWSKLVGNQFLPATIPLPVDNLHERIPALAESFQHVVIDTPPGEGKEWQAPIAEGAVRAANVVLLPVGPTFIDLDRLPPTLDLLAGVERRYGHTPRLHVLLTRVRAGTTSSIATRTTLELDHRLPVLLAEIPLLERYANAFGAPIVDLGHYEKVVEEVLGVLNNG